MNQNNALIVIKWSIRIAGSLTALIGGIFLLVWMTGIGNEFSVRDIVIPKTNLALALLLSSLGLLLLSPESIGGPRRLTGAVFAAMAMLVGTLTLSEHLIGWDLGIDQLLATEVHGVTRTASPNRMGPPASLSMTLAGLGMLALAVRRRTLVPYLGLAICVVNLLPAVGFIYGIHEFYSNPRLTGISWVAVVALFFLGIALVLAERETGPMVVLMRHDAGGALLRRMLPLVILIPLVLGFIWTQGQFYGLYDAAVGTGMLIIALILLFTLLLWQSADHISRMAAAEAEAERIAYERTERIQAMDKDMRLLSELLTNSSQPFTIGYPDGSLRLYNPAYLRLIGYSEEDIKLVKWTDITPPEWRDHEARMLERLRITGEPVYYEKEYIRKDGTRVPVELLVHRRNDDSGNLQYYCGFITDITERRKYEEQLRTSQEQLRALSASLQAAIEEERVRISREIHDELGQMLTGLRMDLSLLAKKLPDYQKSFAPKIESLLTHVDTLIKAVRRISIELRPSELDDYGLIAALESLAKDFGDRYKIQCEFISSIEDTDLGKEISINVFRILQEALTNIARHANAAKVNITVEEEEGNLRLIVEDNGRAITEEDIADRRSVGILGMRERAHVLGGSLRITGHPGKGTTLLLLIPLEGLRK